MNIVHVLWQMSTGGAETMVVDIANCQANYAKVLIIAINDLVDKAVVSRLNPKVEFFCCNRKHKSKSIIPFLLLNWKIFQFKANVIHNHFGELYRFELPFWNKVWTVHNTGYSQKYAIHYKQCFAISESVAKEWCEKKQEIPVVLNGIDCSSISKKNDFKNKSFKHIVQISRLLVKQKGQDLLISAVEKLVLHNKLTNFQVHIIGDGPDKKLLQKSIEEKHLEHHVILLGEKSRDWIYKNLKDYDLLIQPSRFEGFGLTVAEACAAKMPVLVSNIEGPLEILDNGSLGWTFESENVDDLAKKLSNFIENGYNYDLLNKAHDRALREYSIDRTAKQYLLEYKKILNLDKII